MCTSNVPPWDPEADCHFFYNESADTWQSFDVDSERDKQRQTRWSCLGIGGVLCCAAVATVIAGKLGKLKWKNAALKYSLLQRQNLGVSS